MLAATRDVLEVSVSSGSLNAYAQVNIVNHATDMVVNNGTITVNKGDSVALTSALKSALTITPEDYTDVLVWKSGEESIVKEINGQWTPLAGGETTMTATISYSEGNSPTILSTAIKVIVNVPVTDITPSNYKLECNVGDDLTNYITNFFTVNPEDATDKSVTYSIPAGSLEGIVTITDDNTITATKSGETSILVTSVDNSDATTTVSVKVHNWATKATVPEEELKYQYYGNAIDILSDINNQITFLPEGFEAIYAATLQSSNEGVVKSEAKVGDKKFSGDVIIVGHGTATMTLTLEYPNYLQSTAEATEVVTQTYDFVINVGQGLESFTCSELVEMAVGGTYEVVLTPNPVNADFDVDQLSVSCVPNDLPDGWKYMDIEKKSEENKIVLTLKPLLPGNGLMSVSYDRGSNAIAADEESTSDSNVSDNNAIAADEGPTSVSNDSDSNTIDVEMEVSVGVPTTLTKGWQWVTLWGKLDIDTHFSDNAVNEIRSQKALMIYDSNYGYFGELYDNGLDPLVAYKINATKDIPVKEAQIQRGGSYLKESKTQSLLKSWTWIPYPYYHEFSPSQMEFKAQSGDRIVSKDDGFVEYDDEKGWEGTLESLKPWQSYLYYNTGSTRSFNWQPEAKLWTDEATAGNSRQLGSQPDSPWQYDGSRFRDNMSMVARLEGVDDASRYTVGAFVGDECRGEGVCIDGLMFISVYANSGETVSFRLCDELTGGIFDIDQTVKMRLMLGSIASPYLLSSTSQATGIGDIQHRATDTRQAAYDLGGRQVTVGGKGVVMQRMADGSVRKLTR